MMKSLRLTFLMAVMALYANIAVAADFETATNAVANMKVGWNLGNTLESNSGSLTNMWIEKWTDRSPTAYETAWGQKVTTRELIHMMKMAGFNAIRVPVTWYPHMEAKMQFSSSNDDLTWNPETDPIGTEIDLVWMARVKEVVDYVIDEGMYCILNVHHDTGTNDTSWIKANMSNYNKNKDTFEAIWTQIANQFKDYGEKLIFEGYNEMLDSYNSWCFSSMGTSNGYDSNVATDAYNAVNSYAQSFVNTVRATGGNNAQRNLAVCTYAACSGSGTWNSHLQDPLKYMNLPTDQVDGHIMFEIHSYLNVENIDNTKNEIDQMMTDLNTYLGSKAPVIFGEWGASDDGNDYYNDYRSNMLEFAKYFVSKAKQYGFCTLYWMGLSDGEDRTVPQFTQPDLVSSITKGFYGDSFDYTARIKGDVNEDGSVNISDVVLLVNYVLNGGQIRLDLADVNEDGAINVTDVVCIVNIILYGSTEELTNEPTGAPNTPSTAETDVLLSIFSDKYGFPIPYGEYKYPGGWYRCTVENLEIDGTTVAKAVYDEDATDQWTGQAGFWQAAGSTLANGAKKVYLTVFSPDATQVTIEIMNEDSSEKLADVVMPIQNGKWNYLSASVEDIDLSAIGNISVRAGHSTIWFTDFYFAK